MYPYLLKLQPVKTALRSCWTQTTGGIDTLSSTAQIVDPDSQLSRGSPMTGNSLLCRPSSCARSARANMTTRGTGDFMRSPMPVQNAGPACLYSTPRARSSGASRGRPRAASSRPCPCSCPPIGYSWPRRMTSGPRSWRSTWTAARARRRSGRADSCAPTSTPRWPSATTSTASTRGRCDAWMRRPASGAGRDLHQPLPEHHRAVGGNPVCHRGGIADHRPLRGV